MEMDGIGSSSDEDGSLSTDAHDDEVESGCWSGHCTCIDDAADTGPTTEKDRACGYDSVRMRATIDLGALSIDLASIRACVEAFSFGSHDADELI